MRRLSRLAMGFLKFNILEFLGSAFNKFIAVGIRQPEEIEKHHSQNSISYYHTAIMSFEPTAIQLST